jgi:hypothetical protein
MASTVFPVAVSSSTSGARSMIAAAANTMYSGTSDFVPGTYTITNVSSTVTNFQFFNGNTSVTSGVTSSGTVTVNLASAATRILLYTNTGTNIIVTINLTATTVAPVSGTLDTITTTTNTYAPTGAAWVVAVGGGQGGGANGGTGGQVAGAFFTTAGTQRNVTIGAGGNRGSVNPNNPGANQPQGSGGQTVFSGTLTAAGGGAGGSPGTSPYLFVINGSNGNGGGHTSPSVGNGSGIGTGGHWNQGGHNGNGGGYGAGGGAYSPEGGGITNYGGPGGQGIVYVLKM